MTKTLKAVWIDRNALIRKLTIFTMCFSLLIYFGMSSIASHEFFPFTHIAQAVFLLGMSLVAYVFIWSVLDNLLGVTNVIERPK